MGDHEQGGSFENTIKRPAKVLRVKLGEAFGLVLG
jgi:hypothetical protein